MKINQFFGCTSIDEVQLRFDKLSKVFADQDEILQILKTEYSTLMNVLGESKPSEIVKKEETSLSEKIKELQSKVRSEGLHLEIIKDWLWVTGKTYQVRDILKELGFRYSSNKLCWYYRQSEHKSINSKPIPFEMIREKYGASVVAM